MFVGAFIERPRATNGRTYGKHPYENEPNSAFFLFRICSIWSRRRLRYAQF